MSELTLKTEPTWQVKRGSLVLGSGGTMKATCKHRKAWAACGGCYARLYTALNLIAAGKVDDPVELAKRVFDAMKAEASE